MMQYTNRNLYKIVEQIAEKEIERNPVEFIRRESFQVGTAGGGNNEEFFSFEDDDGKLAGVAEMAADEEEENEYHEEENAVD